MKIIDVPQGSPEWLQARLGVPSASQFKNIYTSQGKPSSAQDRYLWELVAESLTGKPTFVKVSDAMQHGIDTEDEARDYFTLESGFAVEQVGFCVMDDVNAGCSPDGFVADGGGLEIKCPNNSTHMKYRAAGKVPAEYYPQVQGSMFVTGRPHWWFMSYSQDYKPLIVKVERDDKWISGFAQELDNFLEKLEAYKEKAA